MLKQYWTAGKAALSTDAAWISRIRVSTAHELDPWSFEYSFDGEVTTQGIGLDLRWLEASRVEFAATMASVERGRLIGDTSAAPSYLLVTPEPGARWSDISVELSIQLTQESSNRYLVLPDFAAAPFRSSNDAKVISLPRIEVGPQPALDSSSFCGVKDGLGNPNASDWLQLIIPAPSSRREKHEHVQFTLDALSVWGKNATKMKSLIGEAIEYLSEQLGKTDQMRFLFAAEHQIGRHGSSLPSFGAVNIATPVLPDFESTHEVQVGSVVMTLAAAWWNGGCKFVGNGAEEMRTALSTALMYNFMLGNKLPTTFAGLDNRLNTKGRASSRGSTRAFHRGTVFGARMASALPREALRTLCRSILNDYWGRAVHASIIRRRIAEAGVTLG